MINLYNIFWFVGIVLGLPLVVPLILLSGKRRKTVFYRLGVKPLPPEIINRPNCDPAEKPLWIHALSVGEVLSAVPLVKFIRENIKNRDVFFSVSTQTGFEIAEKRLSKHVGAIFFFPYDFYFLVKHAVSRINPSCVIMVETDIWPNFMSEMKKRRIPVSLINARLSDKSFKNYKRLSYFSKRMFSGFSKVCAQSTRDADRFKALGVPAERVVTTGNIKFDQSHDTVSIHEKHTFQKWLQPDSRPQVLLAGSTHNGEELIFRDAFIRLKKRYPDLILIIAPRDPTRAQHVRQIFGNTGIDTVQISEINSSASDKRFDVIIIDTIGLLSRIYALADIAFVGGSLVPCGGHNPLEPAAFSKPILFGPDMSDFREISGMLLKEGAALEIKSADNLYRTVAELLDYEKKGRDMGKRAGDLFHANRGALEKTLAVISEGVEVNHDAFS